MNKIFSSVSELRSIANIIQCCMKTPMVIDSIPGSILEHTLSHVRGGKVLNTYDFVDVINESQKIGWQVKSTKAKTSVTWKRAKIPNATKLIKMSQNGESGKIALGSAIIDHCNKHVAESFNDYPIDHILFARLIAHANGTMTYYERILCNRQDPRIFQSKDFSWHWTTPKKTLKKEQLPSFQGRLTSSDEKYFAWHGLGENQLHFYGESAWWPSAKSANHITFSSPKSKIPMEKWINILTRL